MGRGKRDVPLNDQVYEALAAWSKERPDVRTPSFFVTTNGKVKELSDRAVDKLIRKYADQAGLTVPAGRQERKANAQILRNTFAVRLFHEEIAQDKAIAILGITDPQSINRYINAAKNPPPMPEPSDTEKLDTRPKIVKLISRAFPTKPKIAKPVIKIKGPIVPSPEEVIFGRDHVIEDISKHINREESVLIFGL
ncbi:MAG: tyrosine-type recombinase/integrase [Candidatus Margulisbacteria bacterium]|nr:tyrosine-type recombinase/integrase [Candidatus Margulisiibacteriota bacterium]